MFRIDLNVFYYFVFFMNVTFLCVFLGVCVMPCVSQRFEYSTSEKGRRCTHLPATTGQ